MTRRVRQLPGISRNCIAIAVTRVNGVKLPRSAVASLTYAVTTFVSIDTGLGELSSSVLVLEL